MRCSGDNFGAVKIGRSLTALSGPLASTDPWGTWTVGSTHVLGTGYSTDATQPDGAGLGRTDAVTYATAVFSGFTAALSMGTKNSQAVPGTATQPHDLSSL